MDSPLAVGVCVVAWRGSSPTIHSSSLQHDGWQADSMVTAVYVAVTLKVTVIFSSCSMVTHPHRLALRHTQHEQGFSLQCSGPWVPLFSG